MSCVAFIGGTGLSEFSSLTQIPEENRETPWGEASSAPLEGEAGDHRVLFLSRHGNPPAFAAHVVNYRANLWCLREAGAEMVIGVNTVGGIAEGLKPGDLLIPDQIIDYTWGREHSYSTPEDMQHIDFTFPYDSRLRGFLYAAAIDLKARSEEESWQVVPRGTYACTQGPRLESAAEIQRYRRADCAVVGMTAMPEASLARELDLPYASVCLVVNPAAGLGEDSAPVSLQDMHQINIQGMRRIQDLLLRFLQVQLPQG